MGLLTMTSRCIPCAVDYRLDLGRNKIGLQIMNEFDDH